ncbi:MAG: PDDEXK nuclease domain-containing protein [Chloroflexota bacterium]|nr:PDDEXK nuclease domain-containing protein [Chloroflexota bacterium]
MSSEIEISEYAELLQSIKHQIRTAQYEARRAVNTELIGLCWNVGKTIIERQKGDTWGKSVVQQLSKDLQVEFPGIQGFSSSGLWRMKSFYETYSRNPKLAPMVREIGWTHNIVIMEKCKDDAQREFYLSNASQNGWSKNVLIHQIENQTYEKTLLNQTNFDKALPAEIQQQAKMEVKYEYIFDFLELGEEHSERQLQKALLSKLEQFLREMGGLFTFVGSQYRLEVSEKEFFIDILLYHRSLRCLVALDLHVGEFQPEHVGKMQFYLAALDDRIRLPDENPSIGMILCKSKDRTIVEYTLRDSTNPIGVSEYKVVPNLPEELQGQLPDTEQLEQLFAGVSG